MKNSSWFSIATAVAAGLLAGLQTVQAAPKKVLVVSTTTGFRHSSIETGEVVIERLAKQTGEFTVEFARVNPNADEFKGENGRPDKAKADAAVTKVLAEKLSPAALANYDGIIFCNTTGELPLPDREAFLDWIKSGKGFVGMHAATDTLKAFPGYVDMIGGAFRSHGAQVEVEALNQDKACAACQHLGDTWKVYDEIYLLRNFDRSKVHGLLSLDKHPNNKTPGDYPIAWIKEYGQGRVFYTSLGHREDVWDPDWKDRNGQRMNPPEVSKAYQQHILGGIRWALGLVPGDARPQTAPKE